MKAIVTLSPPKKRLGADKVLLAQLCLAGKFREVPEYLFLRRMHGGVSTSAADSDKELLVWFDPENRPSLIPFSGLRLAYETLGAVSGADLNFAQRRACYRSFWRSFFQSRRAKRAAFSQKIAYVDIDRLSDRIVHAKKLIEANEMDAARKACLAILNLRPFTTPVLHLMSIVHHHGGEFERAREMALAAIWRNDHEAAFHNTLGLIEQALGNESAAIKAFERAIACDSTYGEAYSNLSVVLERAGDIERAQQYRAKGLAYAAVD